MKAGNSCDNRSRIFFILFSACFSCVPVQQQLSESEDEDLEGAVDSVVIDEVRFTRTASLLVQNPTTIDDTLLPNKTQTMYEGTFEGNRAYIGRDRIENPKVIKNKLVLVRGYGGPNSGPQRTILLWNGRYYQDLKGQYIVDVVLFTDPSMHRALIFEKKIFDVTALQREGSHSISINLIGYEGLINYSY
ncbi:MAG TPA: hypothetical protein VG737_17950 [Cyclobacteriaceae bacterium]|nr:hypothetical protein [Cyclobacteriaceae bacterium]